MKSLALPLLYALSQANINVTNVYSGQERDAEGFAVVTAQSQEQCDARATDESNGDDFYTWNDEACACFVNIQCEIDCGEGFVVAPTSVCDCVSFETLDSIFLDHGLDEQCQVPSEFVNLDEFEEDDEVNIYNFYGPIFGDIEAFLCENGYDDCPEEELDNGQEVDQEDIEIIVEDDDSTEVTPIDLTADADDGDDNEPIEDGIQSNDEGNDSADEESGLVFEFTEEDDQACRDAVKMSITALEANEDSIARAQLDSLYQKVLDYRDGMGISLIDNSNLLQFMILAFNRDGPNAFVLPSDEVKAYFYSTEGATPFTNIQQLEEALTVVYFQRADNGLEAPLFPDFPTFEPLDSCSMKTMVAGFQIQQEVFRLLGEDVQLINQGQFLLDVANIIGKPDFMTVESPYGYTFQLNDDAVCIEDFIEMEALAVESSESTAGAQLSQLYSDIQHTKLDQHISLVNNIDFITWVMSFQVTEDGVFAPTDGPIYYPPSVSVWLNGENGPITELDQIVQVMNAIFDARVEAGLELNAVGLPYFPDNSGACSEETVLAYENLREQIIDTILDETTLFNQQQFLNQVDAWLSQDLPEADMWYFNSNDGPTCRANFLDTERFYEENMNSYNAAEHRLNDLTLTILDQVHEGCDLVDNSKFLMFITDNRVNEVSPSVLDQFSSLAGAQPFTEVEMLVQALSEMYYARVHLGLETPVAFDLPPFLDTYTCSQETQDAARFLLDEIYDGLEFSQDLINMEAYLISISEWIIEQNTPTPFQQYNRRGGFRNWEDFQRKFNWY